MSARAARGSRRRRGGAAAHDDDGERWLLTYADMITLLMALFMVLFSISSVNTSKFETLKEVLSDAFAPRVVDGGAGIVGGGGQDELDQPRPEPPIPAIAPIPLDTPRNEAERNANARSEQEEFVRLKRLLDEYARANGFADHVETEIRQRGLVIRVLTDRVLFDSASATLKPQATPLLGQIARLVNLDLRHPVAVEGHTDPLPIATAYYPSNWELSGARAASVVRFMTARGIGAPRLSATGFADLRPIAANSTEQGRSRNRRVEIVLLRIGDQGGPTIR
jgi:chemotaxis protein MotB